MYDVWLLYVVVIELCQTFLTVAEQTCADAFPVAATHGERFTGFFVLLTVCAIVELVLIMFSVYADAEPQTIETALADNVLSSTYFDDYTVRSKTDAAEQLSRYEQTTIALAFLCDKRSGGTVIAYNFLRQLIAT